MNHHHISNQRPTLPNTKRKVSNSPKCIFAIFVARSCQPGAIHTYVVSQPPIQPSSSWITLLPLPIPIPIPVSNHSKAYPPYITKSLYLIPIPYLSRSPTIPALATHIAEVAATKNRIYKQGQNIHNRTLVNKFNISRIVGKGLRIVTALSSLIDDSMSDIHLNRKEIIMMLIVCEGMRRYG